MSKDQWQTTSVEKRVTFKIAEIQRNQLVGEKEALGGLLYPVRVVACANETLVLMLHRNHVNEMFTVKEKEKLLNVMSTVSFPELRDVLREIEVLKQVQKIKKNCFMDASNTNKVPRDQRNAFVQSGKM